MGTGTEDIGRYVEDVEVAFEDSDNTHTVEYPILPESTTLETDADNDGVPDSDDAVTGNDGDTTLVSEMISATTVTTVVVPFGYRVALGNIARKSSPQHTRHSWAR